MGLFSWDCRVCGQSMRRAWKGKRDPEAWRADVLVIARTGETHEGAYDGYGRVGEWEIPAWWGDDDERQWLFDARHDEKRAREIREAVAAFEATPSGESEAADRALDALRKLLAHYEESAASSRSLAAQHHEVAVTFTVYHRRCWEGAGRPGFQGQSKRSEDQGG